MSEAQKPAVAYWHLWTDEAGVSHQTRCFFSEFELASMQASIEPQWQGSKTKDGATVFVTVQPVGWVGEWHENPKPQWIIPLSGRWSVQSMDGQQVEMGPGEISFGEDQGTREASGRKGHYSKTVGDKPCVLMIVQFEKAPMLNSACRFR